MRINIAVVQPGRAKALTTRQVAIPAVHSLRELVTVLVGAEVAAYNARMVDMSASGTALAAPHTLLAALTPQQVAEGVARGKVGFGLRYNPQQQNGDQAVQTALLAFEDGLFRVFCNNAPLQDLDTPLALHEGDTLTFLRLVMLSGLS